MVLAELGARTFFDAFARDNTPEDIDSYIAQAFHPQQIAAELADPCATFFLAEVKGQAVGYAKLKTGAAPECVKDPQAVELERIYVDQHVVGQGIGAALMKACLEEAQEATHSAIWLGVWQRNESALAFYRKWGFAQVGIKTFTVGEDVQHDYVMMRSLRTDP